MKAYRLDGLLCAYCRLMLEPVEAQGWWLPLVRHPSAPQEWQNDPERKKYLCPNDGKTFQPPTIELEEA